MECFLTLKGHTDGVRDIINLPNGMIMSGSYDKTIKIWNTTPNLIKAAESTVNSPINSNISSIQYLAKTLKSHLCGVICLLYLTGQYAASGSADYTVKIWDL